MSEKYEYGVGQFPMECHILISSLAILIMIFHYREFQFNTAIAV